MPVVHERRDEKNRKLGIYNPWILCGTAGVVATALCILLARPVPTIQPLQGSLPFGPNDSSALHLSVPLPPAVNVGDSGFVIMTVSTAGAPPPPGLFVDATLTSTDNCTVQPTLANPQSMPGINQSEGHGWTWTAKAAGECEFTFRTAIENAQGVYQTGIYLGQQIKVNKPWDFAAAVQPYAVAALAAILGSVLTAFFTTRMPKPRI